MYQKLQTLSAVFDNSSQLGQSIHSKWDTDPLEVDSQGT